MRLLETNETSEAIYVEIIDFKLHCVTKIRRKKKQMRTKK